jgi:transposase-like protein
MAMTHPPFERFPEDHESSAQSPDEAVVVRLPSREPSPPPPHQEKKQKSQKNQKKRYSRAFRAEAVALASRSDMALAAAAAELAVSPSTLRRWLREASDTEAEQGAEDPRPVHERIDDEWPDWREFDWPVLPSPADSSSTPVRTSSATEAEVPATTPDSSLRRPPARPSSAPAAAPPMAPAVARDLASGLPGDGIFAATARLGPGHRLAVVMAAFAACIVLSRLVPEAYPLRPAVGALHVMSLVASFGAVLLVDWHGLLWLAGRRALTESTRLAAAASPVIWVGLGGLFATGTLLRPDIGSPLTLLKLALVLGVAVNGAVMAPVRMRLAALSADASPVDVPEREWRRMMLSTTVSQIGWWGAVVIGFINSAT